MANSWNDVTFWRNLMKMSKEDQNCLEGNLHLHRVIGREEVHPSVWLDIHQCVKCNTEWLQLPRLTLIQGASSETQSGLPCSCGESVDSHLELGGTSIFQCGMCGKVNMFSGEPLDNPVVHVELQGAPPIDPYATDEPISDSR